MEHKAVKYKIEQVTVVTKPIAKQMLKYYDYCQFTRHFTYDTMRGKVSSINHFVEYAKLDRLEDITNDIINSWMQAQTVDGCKPRTVNNRLKHLLAMVEYFKEYGVSFPGFFRPHIQKQKEEDPHRRAFSREVVYDALKYADRETWLMIKIGFDCGLRIKELRNIRLQDINGNQLEILGKGGKRRFVILSDEVVLRIRNLVQRNNLKDCLWASATKPKVPKTEKTMRRKMSAAFRAAGVFNFQPHELRHSYATDLKHLGASTRSIQYGLGHSSEQTTERYLHDLDASALEELYELKYGAPAPEII